MEPIGYSARKVPIDNFRPRQGTFNSDLAFWGETAIQGTYSGFRMVDIDDPDDPELLVNWEGCASPTNMVGNQGDVPPGCRKGARRPDFIFRSWNSPTPPVQPPATDRGQEGVHVIDVRDPEEPKGFVDTPCGSHTETLVPYLRTDRLLIYSNSSATTTFGLPEPGSKPASCAGITTVVPSCKGVTM